MTCNTTQPPRATGLPEDRSHTGLAPSRAARWPETAAFATAAGLHWAAPKRVRRALPAATPAMQDLTAGSLPAASRPVLPSRYMQMAVARTTRATSDHMPVNTGMSPNGTRLSSSGCFIRGLPGERRRLPLSGVSAGARPMFIVPKDEPTEGVRRPAARISRRNAVGTEPRERRFDGTSMPTGIGCLSRRLGRLLNGRIARLRPAWHRVTPDAH